MKHLIAILLLATTLFSQEPRVLLFSGSTREGSFNKKLIAEAARIAKGEKGQVQIFDLGKEQIPHYDGDIESEKGMPKNAQKLREEMIKSQVIVISTPEYNASISGVLKDALDWSSRLPSGGPSRDAFKGKTFVILSASPSPYGAGRAAAHLKTVVEAAGGKVCSEAFSLENAQDAFTAKGALKDKEKEQKLKTLIQSALKGNCS